MDHSKSYIFARYHRKERNSWRKRRVLDILSSLLSNETGKQVNGKEASLIHDGELKMNEW